MHDCNVLGAMRAGRDIDTLPGAAASYQAGAERSDEHGKRHLRQHSLASATATSRGFCLAVLNKRMLPSPCHEKGVDFQCMLLYQNEFVPGVPESKLSNLYKYRQKQVHRDLLHVWMVGAG